MKMKRMILLVVGLLIFLVAGKAIGQEVIEPEIKTAEYRVVSLNRLAGKDGQAIDFKNAGTFWGITQKFYGQATASMVEAIARNSGKSPNWQNPKSFWLYVGDKVVIEEPLIRQLTVSGSNPTTMTLEQSVHKSLPIFFKSVSEYKLIDENLISQGRQLDQLALDIFVSLLTTEETYHLKGELVHTMTFAKRVQGMTRVKTDVIGKMTVVWLTDEIGIRAVLASDCNNLNLQLVKKPPEEVMPPVEITPPEKVIPPEVVPPKELVPPEKPKEPVPSKKLLLLELEPEPIGGVIKIFGYVIEEKYGPHVEAITEYRFDRAWDTSKINNHGIGNQVSIYANNIGNWWFGPAGMFDTWWGEAPNAYHYNGRYVAPGIAVKYEEAWWNVKTHAFLGAIFEDGHDEGGYKTEKKFRDVLSGDLSISSKNIVNIIPFLEEVNFCVWGRLDPDHNSYRSSWQGKPLTEQLVAKDILGLRADFDLQSLDINQRGTTITVGFGGVADWNKWDKGYGPFATLALGQRLLDEQSGEWKYYYPPHKYFKLYFGVDLERKSYLFKATMFWAEAYYAWQDAKLLELQKKLKSRREVENPYWSDSFLSSEMQMLSDLSQVDKEKKKLGAVIISTVSDSNSASEMLKDLTFGQEKPKGGKEL